MVRVAGSSGDSGLLRHGIRLVISGESRVVRITGSPGNSGRGGHGI